MNLTRISDQSRCTLHQEFETDDSAGEGKQIAFAAMQRLLAELDAADGPSLFVYTSLFRVCFVAGDDFRLPTITRCAPYYRTVESGEHVAAFQIAFPHATDLGRSDENWTKWTANTIEDAAQMILASIQQSAFRPGGN